MKRILMFLFPFLPTSFLLLFTFVVSTEEEQLDHQPDEDEENYIKVAIVEDTAYWVINNVLYQADVVDEEIQREYAKPVDAFEMDYKEVNRLMNILDNMQDWKN
jgi:hypothetical protein